MSHLEDQVVLVTGCSSGIGRALAKEFARRGHRAFASARRLEAIADLKGDRLETVELDVTDSGSIDKAVTRVTERAGRVDIVVNNAGFNVFGPLAEVPLERVKSLSTPTSLLRSRSFKGCFRPWQRAVGADRQHRKRGRRAAHAVCRRVLREQGSATHALGRAQDGGLSFRHRRDRGAAGGGALQHRRSRLGRSRALRQSRVALPRGSSPDREAREASQVDPMDTDVFAARVVELVTRRTPPRVVRLGNGAALFTTLGRLPRPMQDRMMSRRFGLNGLGRSSA
jgi:hypothetical protein